MRLLFLTNLYPPHGQGGYEEWCQEVAGQLRRRGHDIIVLTSQHGDGDESDDTSWVRRELHLEMELASLRNGVQFFTARQQRARENEQLLRSYIRRFQPEAIMIWGMWNIVRALPMLAEELLPGRVVYYMGDYWPTLPSQFEFYWQAPAQHWYTRLPKSVLGLLANWILANEELPRPAFERVIFPTVFMRNELVKRGFRPRESVVIYGAADTAPYIQPDQHEQLLTTEQVVPTGSGAPGGGPNIRSAPAQVEVAEEVAAAENDPVAVSSGTAKVRLLWAGRLRADKGTHVAIKALGRIIHDYQIQNIELHIVGGGERDYITFLEYLIRKQRLESHVTFLGQQPKAAMPQLYQQADIFLFTSVWQEPFGRVLVEAMASGVTVVGSAVGGAAEILIDSANSLTFEPNDDHGLADQIVRLLRSPILCQTLAAAGKQVAMEQFDLQRMVQEIEFYLERMIGRAQRQPWRQQSVSQDRPKAL